MSLFTQLIKALTPSFPSRQDCDQAYLAQACDVFDLERRMREIDQRSHAHCTARVCGFNTP